VDQIRDLGWPGVLGNTDEMLFAPESLTNFASHLPNLKPLWTAIEEMAIATREALGAERLAWLRTLPRIQTHGPMALVHASPGDLWRAPAPDAADAELNPFIRRSTGRSPSARISIAPSFEAFPI
jgi:hypothetical protein